MRKTIIIVMIIILATVFCYENASAQWDRSNEIQDSFVEGKTLVIIGVVGAVIIIGGIILIARSKNAEDSNDDFLVPADSTDVSLLGSPSCSYKTRKKLKGLKECSNDSIIMSRRNLYPAIFMNKEEIYFGFEVQF